MELLLFGNLDSPRLKIGKIAGNQGFLLEKESGKWKSVLQTESGLKLDKEITQSKKNWSNHLAGNQKCRITFFSNN